MGFRQESFIIHRLRGPRSASKTHFKALDALFPSGKIVFRDSTTIESYDAKKIDA